MISRRLAPLCLLLMACARYSARPLDPALLPAEREARRLTVPALLAALDSAGLAPAAGRWSARSLSFVAWRLRPERSRAEAEVRQAEAAVITAGGRPQAGLETGVEQTFSGAAGEPRFGFSLSAPLTVELGGKRGARLARAHAGVMVARAETGLEATAIAWAVRRAVWEWSLAERAAALATAEVEALASVDAALAVRFTEGTLSRLETLRASQERREAEAEMAALRRSAVERQAGVAEAIGVPLSAIGEVRPGAVVPVACAALDSIPGDSLRRLALSRRPELAVVLAGYQLAEGELRIEVSKSWPDLGLAPGLFFDHGANKWTVGFGFPVLPLKRNRGPIAEAEAAREVAARRVAVVQERILGELETALAGCRAAREQVARLDSVRTGATERFQAVREAYGRGELGRLDLLTTDLELQRSRRRRLEARAREEEAGLALDRAIAGWHEALPEEGNP